LKPRAWQGVLPIDPDICWVIAEAVPLGCWELFHELVVVWEGFGVAASTVEPLKWFLRRDDTWSGFC
jgi:hypothetical protein